MSADITLSISIIHHSGLELTRDCLNSIRAFPPSVPYEVIIVDNASTDGAVAMIQSDFPEVRLVSNTRRLGFGENQNRGMEASQGKYLLLLNNDTLVHKDALDLLCTYLDTHPEVGLVGPRLHNADGSLQRSCYRFPSPLRCLYENLLLTAALPNSAVVGDYRAWSHDSERLVDFVSGAAMLVRRSVLEKVGGFDPLFFMYAEETDWQYRMAHEGWKRAFCPEAIITHLGGQSSEGIRDHQFVEFNRSSLKFIRKHYGSSGVALNRMAMIFGSSLRLAIWALVFPILPSRRETARKNLHTWSRLLRWWLGLGPKQGIAEKMQAAS